MATSMDTLTALTARMCAARRALEQTSLIAIDGLGGAGKSHLADALATHMRTHEGIAVDIVHGDDFFLPSERRSSAAPRDKPIGSDFDWRRLYDQVLDPLRRGQDARYQIYDWRRDALAPAWRTVRSGALVIVEGVYTVRPELRPLYDLRVWVECSRRVRLARGLARDGESARSRWEQDWMPCEDHYVSEHEPIATADVIVTGEGPN